MAKIMIIDDNKDYLFSMETYLKKKGFEVNSAFDGQAAMDIINKEKPDLILLDVMMESLFSGFEIWRRLKSDAKLKKIPIICVSGMVDELKVRMDDATKDYEYFDPDAFFEKPVERESVLNKINELLNRSPE
jgi:DNA-binding response OmpR family regulator